MTTLDPSIYQSEAQTLSPAEVSRTLTEPARSTVHMIVFTQHAQRLIRGRPASEGKAAIIGLFGYADRLREVWDAARLSNPYAAWWLIKVEEAHAAAQSKIELEMESVQKSLDAVAEFGIDAASSEPPCRIDLNFACPYAYWGARLLIKFDELARAATIAERVGARPRRRAASNRFHCERALRALFASSLGFRAIGVSREDVIRASEKGLQARELMGEVPATILGGDRIPKLLPPASEMTRTSVVPNQRSNLAKTPS